MRSRPFFCTFDIATCVSDAAARHGGVDELPGILKREQVSPIGLVGSEACPKTFESGRKVAVADEVTLASGTSQFAMPWHEHHD